MIKIGKINVDKNGQELALKSNLNIDGSTFELFVKIYGEEWHQYAVYDRADAFLFGVLPYAMRHGHDIEVEQPVSGKLLYNMNTQYIHTLAKYDPNLYETKIAADSIDTPINSAGAVATGLSCGVDCMHTVVENYNCSETSTLNLTHFVVFNQGAFGGSYYQANRDFAVKKIYAREKALADELNIPIVNISTNLESLMRIPGDQFAVYWMGIMIMSISKLIGTYLYSSSGGDYSDFSVVNTSKKDISYADLLSLHCLSHGATFFYSAGGAKTRFEKFKRIGKEKIVQKHIFSCLNQTFNCGVCPKCQRNLLSIDALDLLDEYRDAYDIDDYLRRRPQMLEYLVREVKFHGYSYSYLLEIYNEMKKKKPTEISNIEEKLSTERLISEHDEYRRQAEVERRALRAYKTLMTSGGIEKLKQRLEDMNIHHVILYYYSYATDIFVSLEKELGITIDYIVEDVKDKRRIPRLPYNTVEYPKCDAIINCNMSYFELSQKKLKERTNNKIIRADELLDLRNMV